MPDTPDVKVQQTAEQLQATPPETSGDSTRVEKIEDLLESGTVETAAASHADEAGATLLKEAGAAVETILPAAETDSAAQNEAAEAQAELAEEVATAKGGFLAGIKNAAARVSGLFRKQEVASPETVLAEEEASAAEIPNNMNVSTVPEEASPDFIDGTLGLNGAESMAQAAQIQQQNEIISSLQAKVTSLEHQLNPPKKLKKNRFDGDISVTNLGRDVARSSSEKDDLDLLAEAAFASLRQPSEKTPSGREVRWKDSEYWKSAEHGSFTFENPTTHKLQTIDMDKMTDPHFKKAFMARMEDLARRKSLKLDERPYTPTGLFESLGTEGKTELLAKYMGAAEAYLPLDKRTRWLQGLAAELSDDTMLLTPERKKEITEILAQYDVPISGGDTAKYANRQLTESFIEETKKALGVSDQEAEELVLWLDRRAHLAPGAKKLLDTQAVAEGFDLKDLKSLSDKFDKEVPGLSEDARVKVMNDYFGLSPRVLRVGGLDLKKILGVEDTTAAPSADVVPAPDAAPEDSPVDVPEVVTADEPSPTAAARQEIVPAASEPLVSEAFDRQAYKVALKEFLDGSIGSSKASVLQKLEDTFGFTEEQAIALYDKFNASSAVIGELPSPDVIDVVAEDVMPDLSEALKSKIDAFLEEADNISSASLGNKKNALIKEIHTGLKEVNPKADLSDAENAYKRYIKQERSFKTQLEGLTAQDLQELQSLDDAELSVAFGDASKGVQPTVIRAEIAKLISENLASAEQLPTSDVIDVVAEEVTPAAGSQASATQEVVATSPVEEAVESIAPSTVSTDASAVIDVEAEDVTSQPPEVVNSSATVPAEETVSQLKPELSADAKANLAYINEIVGSTHPEGARVPNENSSEADIVDYLVMLDQITKRPDKERAAVDLYNAKVALRNIHSALAGDFDASAEAQMNQDYFNAQEGSTRALINRLEAEFS